MIAASTDLHQMHPDLAASFHALLRDSVNLQRQMVTLMGADPCVPEPHRLTDSYLRDLMEFHQEIREQIERAKKPT